MSSACVGVLIDCSGSMEDSLARERADEPGGTKFDGLREAADRLIAEVRRKLDRVDNDQMTKVFVLGFGLRIPGHGVGDLLTLRSVYQQEGFPSAPAPVRPEAGFEGDGHREFRRFAESHGYEKSLTRFVTRYLGSTDTHHLTRALEKNPAAVERLKSLIPRTTISAAGKFATTRVTRKFGSDDPFEEAKKVAFNLIAQEAGESSEDARRRIEGAPWRALANSLTLPAHPCSAYGK